MIAATWPDLELRLRSEVFQKNIRLEDFFTPFDKHRHGLLSTANFDRAILSSSIALSVEELDLVHRHFNRIYKLQPMVDYIRFVHAINAVLFPRDLESHPEQAIVDGTELNRDYGKQVALHRRQRGSTTPRENMLITTALKRIRDRVTQRHFDLKPLFRDFDRFNSGNVSQVQFQKCLTAAGLNLNEDVVALLQRRYSSCKHAEDVDYESFLSEIASNADKLEVNATNFTDHKVNGTIRENTLSDHCVQSTDELLYLLRVMIFSRRVRLFQFLRDSDPLRRKNITIHRFGSVLSSIGNLHLSELQLKELQRSFPHSKETGQIDYQNLHDAIDGTVLVKNLEKVPTVEPSGFTVSPDVAPLNLDQEPEPIVSALNTFSRIFTLRNLSCNSFFKNFDRTNTGFISHHQFKSVLTSVEVHPTNSEIDVVLRRFSCRSKGFCYRSFCKAIDTMITMGTKQKLNIVTALPVLNDKLDICEDAPHPTHHDGGELTLEKTLNRLRTYVHTFEVRLEDAFAGFDPLRKGLTSRNVLARVLDMSGFPCSQEEVDFIFQEFKETTNPDYPESVKWKNLVAAVSKKFVAVNVEAQPSITPVPFSPYHDEGSDESLKETPADTIAIEQILLNLYEAANRYSRNPESWFHDFDHFNRGYVTKRQFRSVLNNAGLNVSAVEVDLLYKRFHRDSNGHVHYRQFCTGIDTFRKKSQQTVDKIAGDVKAVELPRTQRVITLQNTMERLQTIVHRRRLRLMEYFIDFDPLRTGSVSRDVFRRIMDQYGIVLLDGEFLALCTEYAGKDSKIMYREFCKDIEAVFVPFGVEQHPTGVDRKPLVLYDPDRQRPEFRESKEEADIVNAMLAKLHQVVQQRGLNLKPFFEDYDRSNSGSITKEQFHAVICTWAMPITTRECDLIHKRFHHGDHIHYVRFIAALELQKVNAPHPAIPKPALSLKSQKSKKHTITSVSRVLQRLRNAGRDCGLRLRDHFAPFDVLRSGQVTASTFRRVLDVSKLFLSEQEFQLLIEKYRSKSGDVSYVSFCKDFNLASVDETHPAQPARDGSVVPDQSEVDVEPPTATEISLTAKALERLSNIITRRRMVTVDESFSAFDRPIRGRISQEHLATVLLNIGLPAKKETLSALAAVYSKDGNIEYPRLCKDLNAIVSKTSCAH